MYTTHPSEFPAEPLPVMIDPTLLIFGVALLLIALAGGYVLGRSGSDRARRLARLNHHRKLYDDISKVTQEAASAERNQVHHKAERLLRRLQGELGHVIALGPVITAAERLRRSVEQEGDEAAHGDAGAVFVNTGQIIIASPAATDDEADSHHKGSGHAASRNEAIKDVRQAIQDFNDHWSDKAARLDELRRAQIQLSPPR